MRERIIVPHLGSGESRVKMFITYVYVDTHFKVCAHTHTLRYVEDVEAVEAAHICYNRLASYLRIVFRIKLRLQICDSNSK